MSQATAAPPAVDYDSPEMTRKRRSTVTWVIVIAWIGLIFDGYDLVVFGAVLPRLMAYPILGQLNATQAGALGSYAMIGVMIGALTAGTFADIIGRRKVMLAGTAWFSLFMGISAFSTSVTAFSIFRFLTGLGVGALVGVTGAMVAEFAPPGKKNLATAFVYTGVPMGSLLSALLAIAILPPIKADQDLQHNAFRIMFLIGAIPLITIVPLGLFKLPESIMWLAARGKTEEALKLSLKTGVPIPDAPAPKKTAEGKAASGSRAGWAGLFGDYFIAAIIIGFISVACLILVYVLNTWLSKIMLPVLGSSGSLLLLVVLNGGAMIGALIGSRYADKFNPKSVVAIGLVLGVVTIGLMGFLVSTIADKLPNDAAVKAGEKADLAGGMVFLLLVVVALVGAGTSGVQSMLFAMTANYYRTNVRAAGVAWTGGFGRIGGIVGPILGGILAAAFGANIQNIFYVLAGIAAVALVLTLILPKPKAEAVVTELIEPSEPATMAALPEVTGSRLYGTIMVVVDESGNQLTRDRVSEFVSLTGKKVHLVYLAHEGVIAGETGQTDIQINPEHVASLQTYVDMIVAQGVPASGQVLTATLLGRGDAVVDLAEQLHADLIILNTEEGGQRAKAELAGQVARNNPRMAVLVARTTAPA